jgi:ketosteroid isomerase-like protein
MPGSQGEQFRVEPPPHEEYQTVPKRPSPRTSNVCSRRTCRPAGLYETDAVFIPAPDTRVEGQAALGEAFRSTLALKPALAVKPVEVLRNGPLASIANAWTLHATAPDGTPIERSGRSSVVVRREDDGTWTDRDRPTLTSDPVLSAPDLPILVISSDTVAERDLWGLRARRACSSTT